MQLLKDVGAGLTRAETVQHLIDKFEISRSTGYWHFKTLHKWVKHYSDLENSKDLLFKILTQLEHINREASFQYMQSSDPNAKIGFMRVRLDALSKLAEYGILPELSQEVEELKQKVGEKKW